MTARTKYTVPTMVTQARPSSRLANRSPMSKWPRELGIDPSPRLSAIPDVATWGTAYKRFFAPSEIGSGGCLKVAGWKSS